MSVGDLSATIELRWDGEKWFLYTREGKYWELTKDFANLKEGLANLLNPKLIALSTSIGSL